MKERKAGIILNYVLIAVSTLAVLIFTPFIIRLLGQSDYGLYSLSIAIMSYLAILDMGFSSTIIIHSAKYTAKNDRQKTQEMYNTFFTVYFAIGAVALALGFILLLNLNTIFGSNLSTVELDKLHQIMWVIIIGTAISFPLSIFSSIITAHEKFRFQKTVLIASKLITPAASVALLMLGFDVFSLVLVTVIANLSVMLANYFYFRSKIDYKIYLTKVRFSYFKQLLVFSSFIFINMVIDKINWSLDQVILGSVSGTEAVSRYAIAMQFNLIFLSLSTAISSILVPKVSKLVAQNNDSQLSKEFIRVGRLQFYVLLLFLIGFISLGQNFINIWAGPGYQRSYIIALILILPLIIPLTQNTGIAIAQAKNKHKTRALIYLGIAVANVAVSIPLAQAYQGVGSAIGTGASLIIGNGLIMNIYYHKVIKLDIKGFWANIISIFIKQLPVLTAIMATHILFGQENLYSIAIEAVVYVTIYVLYNYLFVINKEEKALVNNVLKRKKGDKNE
ncbi:hypothetical protein CR969_01840 [Candidatus Saccharibacteria bacterium]|nr:MAG: hypothetical protein CR969_01840 [Candidatus Saccharibacteria bacterium]